MSASPKYGFVARIWCSVSDRGRSDYVLHFFHQLKRELGRSGGACDCRTHSSTRSRRSSKQSRKRSGWSSCYSGKQEAECKRVEATGIKDFQDIVTRGISEKLLEWKGIEATMELVKSQNRR